MMYDRNTPLMGPDDLSAEAIQAAFVAHTPDVPGELGQAIHDTATAAGLRPGFLCAELALESAWGNSQYARERRNYSGFGAVDGNPDLATTFDTVKAGCEATAAHWLTYIYGDANTWKNLDPRYDAVMSTGHAGTVRVLGDIGNGIYATDPAYAGKIAAIANALGVSGDAPPVPAPQPGGTPLVISQDLTPVNHSSGRSGQTIQALVLHVMAGTYQGSIDWFKNSAAAASAHYCVSERGEITQCVADDDMAWSNGIVQRSSLPGWLQSLVDAGINPNNVTLSIETAEQPFADGYPTPEEYAAVVALMRQKADEHGIAIDRAHILGHYQFDGVNRKNCPGPHWNWDQLVADIAAGTPSPITPPPGRVDPAVDGQFFPETNHWVANGFWHFWRDTGGLALFGLPLSDEIPDPSGAQLARGGMMTVQYFERACFEYHPENDEGQRVWLKRIGADAAKNAGLTGPGIN